MCGIAGIINLRESAPPDMQTLKGMIAMIQHRGPDQFGIFRDPTCGLVNARLSILDLAGGQQPIANEAKTLWIVYNGELFNDLELKKILLSKGHQFQTQTDTEVVLHLYEEYGPEFLQMINGQYAMAIWDTLRKTLFLARDRIGIRPIYYTQLNNQFLFASEIKAFLAVPGWQASIDRDVLQEIFTYWGPLSPRSIFKNVHEVPPGHYLLLNSWGPELQSYWNPDFSKSANKRTEEDLMAEFEHLLIDASQIRLRADVPVGAYLSGGLDSSTIAAVIDRFSEAPLETFSIQFEDARYDESDFQNQMVKKLNVNHNTIFCSSEDIGAVFPEVIWHTETPILRTSPAPMFLLSKLVHEHGYKVVLTGEGADEMLGGYDIFKENKIRRYIAAHPQSSHGRDLYAQLYPEIGQLDPSSPFLQAFFGKDIQNTSSPFYSHHLRWSNTARSHRFFLEANRSDMLQGEYPISLPASFANWTPLAQAQFLEIKTFLTPYLLSSQGDRMAMAHSVEGRYPFLDYRLMEFANQLPDQLKLNDMQEKWILRQFASKLIPAEISNRRKKPYRAPIHHSFLHPNNKEQTEFWFRTEKLEDSGIFSPSPAQKLLQKAMRSQQLSEMEEMAFVGILSTQYVHHYYVARNFSPPQFKKSISLKTIDLVTAS